MKLSDKGIIIRKTIEDDLPRIFAEGNNYDALTNLPFAFNAANLADIFASGNSICYTAARKKKILGFIAGSVNNNESALRWIYVSKNFRQTGIGKTLLTRYIEESEKSGADIFLIEVLDNNDSSEFFTRFGFKLTNKILKLRL